MEKESKTVLQVNHLTKIYPGDVKAVNNVSFKVKKGEMIAILGPSGAGKSTLLRCMNRLLNKSEGEVLVNGTDITQCRGSALRKLRSDVGMIFQQFNLVPRLTVFENVLAGRLGHTHNPFWHSASVFRLFSERNKQKAYDALSRVGIEHLAPKRADSLSGGQQQRVAIARALVNEPSMILADEPTGNLDSRTSLEVMALFQELNESGITIVLVTHETEISSYAGRVVELRDGTVLRDEAVTEPRCAALDLMPIDTAAPARIPVSATAA